MILPPVYRVDTSLKDYSRVRIIPVLAALMLAAWSWYTWTNLRPAHLASDWHGWRQTDTQTIALNFSRDGASIFYPQINWGGDGPGFVETELQLYPRIISLLMFFFGREEWLGQAVSLMAITGAAIVVYAHLSYRFDSPAAGVGALAFLAART